MKNFILFLAVSFVLFSVDVYIISNHSVYIGEENELSFVFFTVINVALVPGFFFVLFYMIQEHIKLQNKKKEKIIIPIYKPYKNFHPVVTGFLIDHKLNSRDILAGIIFLIEEGIIKMENQYDKHNNIIDYKFILNKNLVDIKNNINRALVKYLFNKIKLNKGDFVEYKYFKRNKDSLKYIADIKWEISKYLLENNFMEKRKKTNIFQNFIFFGLIFCFFAEILGVILFWAPGLILIILGVTTFFNSTKTYSKLTWEIQNNLEGFRLFLEMTEKERIKILKYENVDIDMFRYLSYAVSFQVDDLWRDELKKIQVNFSDFMDNHIEDFLYEDNKY